MEINRTFFNYYLFHPLSEELDCTKQAVYTVATAALGLTTGGLFHLGTYFYLQKKVTPLIDMDIHLAPTSSDNLEDLIAIIEKQGNRIKTIDFRDFGTLINDDHIRKIIHNCPKLNHLFLSTNINRSLALPELETLNISCEDVSFPDLANFPKLKSLSLLGDIKNFPYELSCPSLEKLSLGSKTLSTSEIDLPNLSGCINLKELTINNIRFFSLPSISSLVHLETLALTHFKGLCDLTPLTKLKKLSLIEFYNFNESKDLDTLKNLETLEIYAHGYLKMPDLNLYPNLKSLSLITTGGPHIPEGTVFHCPKLEKLTLGSIKAPTWLENRIKLPDLSPLNNLKELTITNLNFGKLPGLNTLRNLEKLHLSKSNTAILDDFTPLVNLKHLTLRDIKYYTHHFHVYENRLKGIENLESLELCKFETLPDLKNLKLKRLTLEDCQLESLDSLPLLEELDLRHMEQLKLGSNFPNLKKLILQWCKFETLNLSPYARLKSLDFFGCKIGNLIGLQTLIDLERLYLFDCESSFQDLGDLSTLKKLKELNINWGKLNELKGLNALTNLRRFVINILLSIEVIDLSGADRLEFCEITACSKLHTLKLPAKLPRCTHLKVTSCDLLNKE